MKKLFTFLVLLVVTQVSVMGQTTLNPGDLMMVTVNADGNKNFDFVPLVDLSAGTVIYFTDDAWTGSALNTNEGIIIYTASSSVTAGTVVSYPGSTGGEWSSSGSFNPSGSGDEILVYQGSSSSPNFILGVGWAMSTPWISTGTPSTNNSYIPAALSAAANTIVSLGTSDDYQYKTANGITGTKAELLALTADGANFNSNNSSAYSALSTTFTINSGSGPDNPSGFSATTASVSQIDLSWTQNGSSNNVMVAYSSDGTFGTPTNGSTYAASDGITGGGTVIYNGSATSYNHTSLTSGTQYYYKAWSVDGSKNYSTGVTGDATTYKNEPTNQVASFAVGTPTSTTIPLTWSDNDGAVAADGYLIMANTTGTFTAPVDGTAQTDDTDLSDGSGQVNVAHGAQTYTFTGLNTSTTYYFKIWAYTNSGTAIDYKTGGTVPTANTATTAYSGPNAWINEFHYDNISTDAGEFVEIVIENPGSYTLSDFKVYLYNGSGGVKYDSTSVDNLTGTGTIGNYTFYSWQPSSIQNGSPDGLALSYQGTLIPGQFLSYEGTFTATDGPANGVGSTDVGVQESGSTTPVGYSLQLSGKGTKYSDFTWQGPAPATDGSVNKWQSLSSSTIAGLWNLSAGSTDWGTASNWNDGNVPVSTTDVLIPTGASNYPVVNENAASPATCNSLFINSSASLTVNPGKALTVSGDLTDNGTLTLASDATGNGSLIINGTATGNVTVQRYIPAYTSGTDGWHLVSVPFDADPAGTGFDPTGGATNDLYSWDESANLWKNYRAATFTFTKGNGFLMAQSTSTTNSISGTPNNADVPLSNLSDNASQGNGWHLLGNPFTSALTWGDANWSLSNVAATAKMWSNSAGNYMDVSAGETIPSTNGFFVQVTSATNSLTIPAADRLHDGANNNKSTTAGQETLKFKITDDANTYYDQNTLGFKSDATEGFDPAYDSHKLLSLVKTAPQLWTVSDDQNFSTNYLPQPQENISVPLDFQAGATSAYHLSWTGLDNMDHNLRFTLEDKQTGTTLNMADVSAYDFDAATTDDPGRFVLHINGTTGVKQLSTNSNIMVYAQGGDIYIKAKDNSNLSGTLALNNLGGQVVYNTVLNGTSQQIVHTRLNTGIYIVRMKMKDGSIFSQKVMIQ